MEEVGCAYSRATPITSDSIKSMNPSDWINALKVNAATSAVAVINMALKELKVNNRLPAPNISSLSDNQANILDPISSKETEDDLVNRLSLWAKETDRSNCTELETFRKNRNMYHSVISVLKKQETNAPVQPLAEDKSVFGDKDAEKAYKYLVSHVSGLYDAMGRKGLLPEGGPNVKTYRFIMKSLSDNYNGMSMVSSSRVPDNKLGPETNGDLAYHHVDASLMTDQQKLLQFVLDQANTDQLRKLDGDIYIPVVTPADSNGNGGGAATGSYKYSESIKDWINSLTPLGTKGEQWQWMNTKGTPAFIQSRVTDTVDHRLPTLNSSRYRISFRNGTYSIYLKRFFTYANRVHWHKLFSDGKTACNYIDKEFDMHRYQRECGKGQEENPCNIRTPAFDTVMASQGFRPEYVEYILCLMGRMQYDVNTFDHWELALFFYGLPGTGKSTLLSILKMIYSVTDTGIISDTIEEKFGLEALFRKFIIIGPDISNKLSLSQTCFQSMATGEQVSVGRKNKTALGIEWVVPMAMAGNRVPNWEANGGSVTRRLAAVNFKVPLDHMDPRLKNRLKDETPALIHKSNLIYRRIAAKHDDTNKNSADDIWDVLPKEFMENRKELDKRMCTVTQFLSTKLVTTGDPAKYCRFSDLEEVYKKYVKHNVNRGNQSDDLDPVTYTTAFKTANIKVRHESKEYPPNSGEIYTGLIAFGIGIRENVG
jgi:hypothetical protein